MTSQEVYDWISDIVSDDDFESRTSLKNAIADADTKGYIRKFIDKGYDSPNDDIQTRINNFQEIQDQLVAEKLEPEGPLDGPTPPINRVRLFKSQIKKAKTLDDIDAIDFDELPDSKERTEVRDLWNARRFEIQEGVEDEIIEEIKQATTLDELESIDTDRAGFKSPGIREALNDKRKELE